MDGRGPHSLEVPLWAWALLAAFVLACLVLDLAMHRAGRRAGRSRAAWWSLAWLAAPLVFGAWVCAKFGRESAAEFATAYLTEKSLSVDVLFVFLVVFAQLGVPPAAQHRVLFWGVLGALVSRAAFVAGGVALLGAWHDVIYVLGALLVYAGWKTARAHGAPPREGRVLPFLRRHLRVSARLDGQRFFTWDEGHRVGTPLVLAMLTIEATDVAFAVDSVPAVLAISEEPFIVYSSNVFAVLGLRALYLVLAELLRRLRYLRLGLAALLVVAGGRMLTCHVLPLPRWVSPLTSITILAAVLAMALVPPPAHEK